MDYPEFILLALPYIAATSTKVEFGLVMFALGLMMGWLFTKGARR